jgi:hypothetical protein
MNNNLGYVYDPLALLALTIVIFFTQSFVFNLTDFFCVEYSGAVFHYLQDTPHPHFSVE